MNQDLDFEIIWKKINHQLTESEQMLFDEWFSSNKLNQQFYQSALKYYSTGTQFSNSPSEIKRAFRKIRRELGIPVQNYRINTISIVAVAASILAFVYFRFSEPSSIETKQPVVVEQVNPIGPGSNKAVLILSDGSTHDLTDTMNAVIVADGAQIINKGNKLEYANSRTSAEKIQFNTINVPRGGEYLLVLSDSTVVRLNSETSLRYPVQFAGATRNVELIGEAYFEVKRNDQIPFVVISGNQQVKVLGTQFNISCYPENENIATTLVEGKVEVSCNGYEQKVDLKPGQQSLFNLTEGQITKNNVDVLPYIAWKDGRFLFHDQPLEDIMKTLSKWYNVEIDFSKNEDKKLRFTGNLKRSAEFKDILAKIELTNEVKFEINGNTILIK